MRCNYCMTEWDAATPFCPYCGKKASEDNPPHRLATGTLLHGKFEIGAAIGEGGFGITYVGYDRTLDLKVAVKEYYPTGFATRNNTVSNEVTLSLSTEQSYYQQGKEQFLREARSMARFSAEEGIVDVREYFTENNTAYIVMEYLDGVDLGKYIHQHGKQDARQMFEKMLPLMRTLQKMHKKGVIHRDIAPDNIMLLKNGKLKLMDFGSARFFAQKGVKTMSVLIKPGYSPFEQFTRKGAQGPWTDVYSLCATIYNCITAETPPDALDRSVEDDLKKPSELGVSIPAELEDVLMKGLAIHPNDRLQSMDELIAAVEAIEKDTPADTMKPVAETTPANNKPPVIPVQNTNKNATMFADEIISPIADAAEDKNTFDNEESYDDEKRDESENPSALMEQRELKGEVAKTEKTYSDALALMNDATGVSSGSIEKLNKAITLFDSVIEYEDSKKMIDECKHRLEVTRAGIESKKKKAKKIAVIAGIAIAVLISFVVVLNLVIIPTSNYNNAVSMLESGDYDKAISAFEAMGDYKDVKEKITECNYRKAEAYFESGKYKEASEIYEIISDYSDAKEKYNESIYQMALAYYTKKDYDNSNPLFEKIMDYKDSADKIHYHDWKKTNTVDATCTEKGSITYKCSCGETKTEDIAALGHDWKDATCTEPMTCKRCGEKSGSALGHTDGAKCERCGKILFETITQSGTGFGTVNFSIPKGQYIVHYKASRTTTGEGGLQFHANVYYENGNLAATNMITVPPNSSAEQDARLTGPMNSRIDIDALSDISWTVTIKAV